MTTPRIKWKLRLSIALICVGIVVLCFSPWAGATAGKTSNKVLYHEAEQKSVYAIVTTTEVDYFNVDNRTALWVMGVGIALSMFCIFGGVFFYNRTRLEEIALLNT